MGKKNLSAKSLLKALRCYSSWASLEVHVPNKYMLGRFTYMEVRIQNVNVLMCESPARRNLRGTFLRGSYY